MVQINTKIIIFQNRVSQKLKENAIRSTKHILLRNVFSTIYVKRKIIRGAQVNIYQRFFKLNFIDTNK